MKPSTIRNMSQKEAEELLARYMSTYDLKEVTFTPPSIPILDTFITERILAIYNAMQANHNDHWLLISGPEGSGKTTLTTGIIWEWCIVSSTDFMQQLNTNIAFDDDDMTRLISKIDTASHFQYIWADEGANVFQNRESTTGPRKIFVKFANAIRWCQPFVVIDAVEMKQLDTILLNHRIKSMIRIERPGVYHYFNQAQFHRLLQYNEKRRDKNFNWSATEPEHVGRFGFSREFSDLANTLKENYFTRLKMEAERQNLKSVKKKLALFQEMNGKNSRHRGFQ